MGVDLRTAMDSRNDLFRLEEEKEIKRQCVVL